MRKDLHIWATALLATAITSLTVHADNLSISALSGSVDAVAHVGSSMDGTISDTDHDSASSIADLPITATAAVASDLGASNSSADLSATHSNYELTLEGNCASDGSATGAPNATASGQTSFDVRFTVDIPTLVSVHMNVALEGDLDGWDCGSAEVVFEDDMKDIEWVSTKKRDIPKSVEFEMLLEPGHVYSGSGDANAGGGSSTPCNATVQIVINVICGTEGALALGDNAFDSSGATGINLDLSGHCDPGEFGNDLLYNTIYFSFTPDVTTTYTFSTCNQASFDTRLAVLASLCDESSVLACLDDTDGCENYTTELSLDLVVGTVYRIVIGGYGVNHFGEGTLSVSALPIIVESSGLEATLFSDAYAYFCGDEWEDEQSDSDTEEATPSTLEELPESVSAGAFTCCSSGSAGANLSASTAINAMTLSASASASACGDWDGFCANGSAYGSVDATFGLLLTHHCELTIEWAVYGDGGGSGDISIETPDGTILLQESADWDFNEGTTVFELSPGVHRVHLGTYASGDGINCGGIGAEGGSWANLQFIQMAHPIDLNGDGFIDGADLAILLGSWGICPAPCPADIDGNGVVDGADLTQLLGAWMSG